MSITKRAAWLRTTFVFLILTIFVSCGLEVSDSASESKAPAEGEEDHWDNGIGGDYDSYEAYEAAESDGSGSQEQEVVLLSRPVVGNKYVFVLNRLGRTAVAIEAETLRIRTFKVGEEPEIITTVPGKDVALILCKGTDELYLLDLRTTEARLLGWKLSSRGFAGYNDIVITPSGKFAILFFNYRKADPNDELGALQEVAIIDLSKLDEFTEETSPFITRTVSLNPTQVLFTANERKAIVITDYGLNVIDLSDPTYPVSRSIGFGDDPQLAKKREVQITPDGLFAIASWSNRNVVAMVDIETGVLSQIALDSPATDIELTPDGSALLAVLKESQKLIIVDVPNGFADSNAITEIPLQNGEGQVEVSPNGKYAILFTNSDVNQETISVLDLETRTLETVELTKAVKSVAFSPDSSRALIVHQKKAGNPDQATDIDERIDRSYGYSVYGLNNEVLVLNLSDADVSKFIFTPNSQKLYLLITDGSSIKQVHIVDLSDGVGAYASIVRLGSIPQEVGVMEQVGKTFVSQDHRYGRITFFDWLTDEMITITGFELNSEIE